MAATSCSASMPRRLRLRPSGPVWLSCLPHADGAETAARTCSCPVSGICASSAPTATSPRSSRAPGRRVHRELRGVLRRPGQNRTVQRVQLERSASDIGPGCAAGRVLAGPGSPPATGRTGLAQDVARPLARPATVSHRGQVATQRAPAVRARAAANDVELVFLPTYSSWPNWNRGWKVRRPAGSPPQPH